MRALFPLWLLLKAAAQSPSKAEVDHYNALVALRRAGATCPNGQSFPPNSKVFAFDCRLWRAARAHSQDMATKNYFDHVTPDGRDPCAQTKAFGLQACSQNIAGGQATALDALNALKASPHHCPNMMDPALTRIGVGFFSTSSSTYKNYWTQNMGADACPVDQSCSPPGVGAYAQPAPCDSCRDFSDGCKNYQGYAGSSHCSETWPREQCPKTCGFCKPASPTQAPAPKPAPAPPKPAPAPTGGCSDKHSACTSYQGYAGTSYCSRSFGNGWAVENCPKTCELC